MLEKWQSQGNDRKVFYKCDSCQQIFDNSYDLMHHSEIPPSDELANPTTKTPKRSRCEVCDKSFATEFAKDKHRKRRHSALSAQKEKENKSDTCQKIVEKQTPSKLMCHIKIPTSIKLDELANQAPEKARKFDCDLCDQSFTTKLLRDKHRKRKHVSAEMKLQERKSKSEALQMCQKIFEIMKTQAKPTKKADKPTIKTRKKKEVPEKFSCDLCGKSFTTRYVMNKHVKRQVCKKKNDEPVNLTKRRRKEPTWKKFECDVCDKSFTTKYALDRHKQHPSHANDKSVELELKKQKTKAEVMERCRKQGLDGKWFFKCETCQKSFKKWHSLWVHRITHTGAKEYSCKTCDKSYATSYGLEKHTKSVHEGIKKFQCKLCDKAFMTRYIRDEHMNTHTNSKPFKCDICSESFASNSGLYFHKMSHSDTNKFECKDCGKKFQRSQHLKVHSWVHTGYKPHSCHKCKAAFTLRYDLDRHMKVHEKVIVCMCDVCGRVFSRTKFLRAHKNKMHKEASHRTGIKKLSCNYCEKSFSTSDDLVKHTRAYHTENKTFRCDVCDMTFRKRISRDEHMNIHTDNRPYKCKNCSKSFRHQAALSSHKKIHIYIYRFACNYCLKKFKTFKDLEVHSWLHTGYRPHPCDKCKAAFRYKGELRSHLKVHEKGTGCECFTCGRVFSKKVYLKVHWHKLHGRTPRTQVTVQ